MASECNERGHLVYGSWIAACFALAMAGKLFPGTVESLFLSTICETPILIKVGRFLIHAEHT